MFISHLENTINIWIDALHQYDIGVLQVKPDKNSWSLGQVYNHILHETNYYIQQVETCISTGENEKEHMTEFAEQLFTINELPDEKIQGNVSANQAIVQPTDKASLIEQMLQLKASLISLWSNVLKNNPRGKTKHPSLGYFTAGEWLRFSEIHMRHHLRQKRRIEAAVKLGYSHEK